MKELVVAPEHGVYIQGKFYLPRQLVNRASILEETSGAYQFWAVELSQHNVIVAEGLPVESFIDDGRRKAFTEITAPRLKAI